MTTASNLSTWESIAGLIENLSIIVNKVAVSLLYNDVDKEVAFFKT